MNNRALKGLLERSHSDVRDVVESANKLIVGRKVRIVSDYNGQPYGRSKKSLRGSICTVAYVCIVPEVGVSLILKEYEYGYPSIGLNEVEFIEG